MEKIAVIALLISVIAVCQASRLSPPGSVTREFTETADKDGNVYLSEAEYEILAAILEKEGLDIDTLLDIFETFANHTDWQGLLQHLGSDWGGCDSQTLMCKFCVPTVDVCVSVQLLAQNIGFKVAITYQGVEVISKEISAANPPAICVPGVRLICVQFYDISLARKHFCLKIKTLYFINIPIGCFNL